MQIMKFTFFAMKDVDKKEIIERWTVSHHVWMIKKLK